MIMEELIQKKLHAVFNDESIVFDKSRFAGGLTNYNYIMTIKGTEYVVRQPGGMTNLMIDRSIEKMNNLIASELGLNSECIYFDEHSGIKISVYIENSRNVAVADPAALKNIKAVSDLMKKTHRSQRLFPNQFDWIIELEKYESIVRTLNGDLFFDYLGLKEELIQFFNSHVKALVSVPCHNDTVPENFIVDDQDNAYLIDWEYSGMNDPSWDVAAYILESKLEEEPISYLISDYYGQSPSDDEMMKIKCFMLVQDLLWTAWALIRHYNGDDFLEYCNIRYERFRKNMNAMKNSTDYAIAEMVKN